MVMEHISQKKFVSKSMMLESIIFFHHYIEFLIFYELIFQMSIKIPEICRKSL